MKIGPMNLGIPDCHPFFRIEWTSEILSDGASTRLGPVSHKCKSVVARVFPGRHVYSARVRTTDDEKHSRDSNNLPELHDTQFFIPTADWVVAAGSNVYERFII